MMKPFDLEWLKATTSVPDDFTKDYVFADDLIFMQFTGKYDKGGKEIYEGDILGDKDGRHAGVVEFDDDVQFSCCDEYCNEWMRGSGWINEDIFRGEYIIGNIYENPELVK